MNRKDAAALFHVLAWVVVIGVGLLTRAGIPVSRAVARPLGFMTFLLGMTLFAWGVAHLKGAFLGEVEPISDTLTTTGPYRFVRHPVYLGMLISSIGLIIGMRSLWGMVSVVFSLLPAGIYRATLEEEALARTFGGEWDTYTKATYFMFPPIW